jgi:ribonuclease Z
MPEITFLGTGGAFPTKRRSTSKFLIESPGFCMLVETGPDVVQQLARADRRLADIGHLFVSHSHGDHTLGFPILILNRSLRGASTRLHVYAGPDTIATLEMLWTLAYPDFDSNYLKCEWHHLSERGSSVMDISPGITLRTVLVPYPPGAPTLAARWDFVNGPSLSYITDTYPNDDAAKLAHGCDLLIHDSQYSATLQPDAVFVYRKPHKYYHSTAQQAGQVARQAGCPHLVLVHMGPEIGNHPDVLADEARAGTDLQVIIPEDGDAITIPWDGDRVIPPDAEST